MTETKASPAELLRYVADNLEWLSHRPEGPDAFDELHFVLTLVESTIGARVLGPYAGPCDVCGRDMYARTGALVVECRPCNLIYDVEPRRAWLLEQAADELRGAAEMARVLSGFGLAITDERIRKWADRDDLKAAGVDRAGRPLYRVRDVQKLLAQRPATRRKNPKRDSA
jgi:hypothetical protein